MKIEIECIDCKDSRIIESVLYALEQCKGIAWKLSVTKESGAFSWYSNISLTAKPKKE